MKFICEECEKPCILDIGNYADFEVADLGCVIKNSGYCKWKSMRTAKLKTSNNLATNLQHNELPKLTAEVFDRPDCPEWAKYAAVDKDGKGFYYKNKPKKKENKKWSLFGVDDYQHIGIFDASDWQNSLVERPKNHVNWDEVEEILCNSTLTFKEKKQELPDWLKVGAWVWFKGSEHKFDCYACVTEINKKGVYGKCPDGQHFYSKPHVLAQARIRPYNAEEIPDLPFEVTEKNSNFRTVVVSCQGNKVWLGRAITAISTEELMRDFTAKGKRCGVLEHLENGEWVR